MVGAGLTVMLTVLAFVVPATEAVSVVVSWVVMPVGAVYMTEAPVGPERLPHALEVHAAPESDQDTVEPPETVELTINVCPASRVTEEADRLVIPPPAYPPVPHPDRVKTHIARIIHRAAPAFWRVVFPIGRRPRAITLFFRPFMFKDCAGMVDIEDSL